MRKNPKPLVWLGGSLIESCALPAEARQNLGCLLYALQQDVRLSDFECLPNIARGKITVEILDDSDSGRYRALYVANTPRTLYVIHVIDARPIRAEAASDYDMALISARSNWVVGQSTNNAKKKTTASKRLIKSRPSTGNVFTDLELENPEELKIRAKIAIVVASDITRQGLKTKEVSRVLGISQPQVAALLRGQLNRFSIERLVFVARQMGLEVNVLVSTPRNSA